MAMQFGGGAGSGNTPVLDAMSATIASDADFTVSFWMRPTTMPAGGEDLFLFASLNNGASPGNIRLTFGDEWGGSATACNVFIQNGGYDSPVQGSAGDIVLDEWAHYTLVRDGDTSLRAYKNGVLMATNTTSTAGIGDATTWNIGESTKWSSQVGEAEVAHVITWTRALTVAELTKQAHQSKPHSFESIYNWLPLTDAAGDDWSGNGNHHGGGEVLGSIVDGPLIAWGPQGPIVSETATAGGSALDEIVDETVGVTEATLALLSIGQVVNDTEAVAEDVIALLGVARAIAETESVTETTFALLGVARFVDEVEGVTETTLALLSITRVVAETESITEATLALVSVARLVDETESITETTVRPRVMVRLDGDREDVTETVLALVATAPDYTQGVDDTQVISEAPPVRTMEMVREVGEIVGLTETTVFDPPGLATATAIMSCGEWSTLVDFDPCDEWIVTLDGPSANAPKVRIQLLFTQP